MAPGFYSVWKELPETLDKAGYYTGIAVSDMRLPICITITPALNLTVRPSRSLSPSPPSHDKGKNHFGLNETSGTFFSHGYTSMRLYEGLLENDPYDETFVLVDTYDMFFNNSCPGCNPLATQPEDIWNGWTSEPYVANHQQPRSSSAPAHHHPTTPPLTAHRSPSPHLPMCSPDTCTTRHFTPPSGPRTRPSSS